jgi:hypothetical protein
MENEWFEVYGVVSHVKLEPDGDLHVQLRDEGTAANSTTGYLIVEVPKGSPWCAIRRTIFSWTTTAFPRSPGNLTLTSHPAVTIVGRAFYDGFHAPGGDTTANSRAAVGGVTAAIWEIHPVIELYVWP